MTERLVELINCGDLMSAEMLKETLISEGIHAFIHGGHTSSLFMGLGVDAMGGHPIIVAEVDLERARAVLAKADEGEAAPVEGTPIGQEMELSEPENEDRICNHCGSDLIYLDDDWGVTPFDILFLGIPLLFRKKGFVCKSCGEPWLE